MVPLPAKISGGYWQSWGRPSVQLKDVPPALNVVLIAFAHGDGAGGGRLELDLPTFQSVSSFTSDIAELHSRGRSVVLSVGGSNDMDVHLTTSAQVTEMVSSLDGLIATYGFDGIDWDL